MTGGQLPPRRSSYMSPKLLTANLLSVAIVVSNCAFFAPPLRAQEKADLAKLSAQIRDKDAAVRQSAIEAIGQLKDLAAIDLLISALTDGTTDVRSEGASA